MQTKKRIAERNACRERSSPRISSFQGAEKKVTDLITSSARKQRLGGAKSKKKCEPLTARNLNTRHESSLDTIPDECLEYNSAIGAPEDATGCEEGPTIESETIFSPVFHTSKIAGEETTGGDSEVSGLASEVSAVYLATKTSKLECVDEQGPNVMSADICVDDEVYEEYEDFDPYHFIKNLPHLSAVVPTFRPVLLPKQTRSCPRTTLVLDLDETLVHSTLELCDDSDFTFPVNFNFEDHTVYVRCRPYLNDFLERVSSLFEIIIFTASQSIYASKLLNVLDPKRKFFRHRVYRDSCVFVDGNYLKDLTVLGRDLERVIIIDNSPQAFGFQVENGIPIESWYNDRSDQELLHLLPFLESLVGVEDVRPLIANKFNLRQRITGGINHML